MEDDVKNYLKDNPDFFEHNAHLLTEMSLPNPHGEGAISLAQRQQLAQRDKIHVLESKFTQLVLNAEENEQTANKVHRLTLGLLGAQNFKELDSHLIASLDEDFDLSNAQLKVWSTSSLLADEIDTFEVPNEAIATWAQDLSQPYCGKMPTVDLSEWLLEKPESIAIIPLKDKSKSFEDKNSTIGLLLIPSQDRNHFYNGMGTMFLNRIGELVSASLLRYING